MSPAIKLLNLPASSAASLSIKGFDRNAHGRVVGIVYEFVGLTRGGKEKVFTRTLRARALGAPRNGTTSLGRNASFIHEDKGERGKSVTWYQDAAGKLGFFTMG